MEEEDGRRRDGSSGRAGRAATRARAAVAMAGREGEGEGRSGAEAEVNWREVGFGIGWGFELLVRDTDDRRYFCCPVLQPIDTPMGRPLACAHSDSN
jgi:hypothetical protein